MKYYKDHSGKVFAFESDGSQDQLIKTEMQELTAAEKESHLAVIPSKPEVVSKRQAEKALYMAGRLADVEAVISAMPEPDQTLARIDWEKATQIERDWPITQELAAALDLSETDLDDLFATAAGL